jgi:plasmid stabilization system protein ParE
MPLRRLPPLGTGMAYRVLISDDANEELDTSVQYITITLGAPGAAASILDEFEEKLSLISENPRLFGVDFDVSEAVSKQVRKCLVKGYSIFYTIDDGQRTVNIVAFVHELRDTQRYFLRKD